jgi:hypothetical protein
MAVFCSSLTSWFPGMLLTCFLNDFEIFPVASIITGINFVFTILLLLLLLLLLLFLLLWVLQMGQEAEKILKIKTLQ